MPIHLKEAEEVRQVDGLGNRQLFGQVMERSSVMTHSRSAVPAASRQTATAGAAGAPGVGACKARPAARDVGLPRLQAVTRQLNLLCRVGSDDPGILSSVANGLSVGDVAQCPQHSVQLFLHVHVVAVWPLPGQGLLHQPDLAFLDLPHKAEELVLLQLTFASDVAAVADLLDLLVGEAVAQPRHGLVQLPAVQEAAPVEVELPEDLLEPHDLPRGEALVHVDDLDYPLELLDSQVVRIQRRHLHQNLFQHLVQGCDVAVLQECCELFGLKPPVLVNVEMLEDHGKLAVLPSLIHLYHPHELLHIQGVVPRDL
mmetsp:Transcript_50668/g.120960  ORF Transcript_50668/g.120960 Transcript_50668/m.120960 type:complete len:313 (-) Transcript_50668:794-1732(-)